MEETGSLSAIYSRVDAISLMQAPHIITIFPKTADLPLFVGQEFS
jgi:hypothetical protein